MVTLSSQELDQGLGPRDHSTSVCESRALVLETFAKNLGLALEIFCQGLGLKGKVVSLNFQDQDLKRPG